MRVFDRIGPQIQAKESIGKRTRRGKTFFLGKKQFPCATCHPGAYYADQRVHVVLPKDQREYGTVDPDCATCNGEGWVLKDQWRHLSYMTPLHYLDDDGVWQDIDLTPIRDGPYFVIDRAPFVLRVAYDRPEAWYEGRETGKRAHFWASGKRQTRWDEDQQRFVWRDVAKDADVTLLVRPMSVLAETWLKSANAPHKALWDYEGGADPVYSAQDAEGRKAEWTGNEWTGRVSEIVDRRTRQRRWVETPSYPVRIV